MHRIEVGVVNHMNVAVNLFFGVEDLTALRTHVLSCSGFRGAFAFDNLTQFSTSLIKKKEKVA